MENSLFFEGSSGLMTRFYMLHKIVTIDKQLPSGVSPAYEIPNISDKTFADPHEMRDEENRVRVIEKENTSLYIAHLQILAKRLGMEYRFVSRTLKEPEWNKLYATYKKSSFAQNSNKHF